MRFTLGSPRSLHSAFAAAPPPSVAVFNPPSRGTSGRRGALGMGERCALRSMISARIASAGGNSLP
eukprot:8724633-Pyramimonas_sp.AAC.1